MKRAPLARKTALRAKSPIRKRSRPKMAAARKSARDQDCTLQFPGCQNARETVVLCHLRMFGGGGMGIKPDDAEAVYGCDHCHSILDGRANADIGSESIWEYVARALVRTHRAMRANGVMIFKGEAA